eukprot:Partr_v1_DN27962_c0_g1_i1_m11813 putative protein kinase kinase kinase
MILLWLVAWQRLRNVLPISCYQKMKLIIALVSCFTVQALLTFETPVKVLSPISSSAQTAAIRDIDISPNGDYIYFVGNVNANGSPFMGVDNFGSNEDVLFARYQLVNSRLDLLSSIGGSDQEEGFWIYCNQADGTVYFGGRVRNVNVGSMNYMGDNDSLFGKVFSSGASDNKLIYGTPQSDTSEAAIFDNNRLVIAGQYRTQLAVYIVSLQGVLSQDSVRYFSSPGMIQPVLAVEFLDSMAKFVLVLLPNEIWKVELQGTFKTVWKSAASISSTHTYTDMVKVDNFLYVVGYSSQILVQCFDENGNSCGTINNAPNTSKNWISRSIQEFENKIYVTGESFDRTSGFIMAVSRDTQQNLQYDISPFNFNGNYFPLEKIAWHVFQSGSAFGVIAGGHYAMKFTDPSRIMSPTSSLRLSSSPVLPSSSKIASSSILFSTVVSPSSSIVAPSSTISSSISPSPSYIVSSSRVPFSSMSSMSSPSPTSSISSSRTRLFSSSISVPQSLSSSSTLLNVMASSGTFLSTDKFLQSDRVDKSKSFVSTDIFSRSDKAETSSAVVSIALAENHVFVSSDIPQSFSIEPLLLQSDVNNSPRYSTKSKFSGTKRAVQSHEMDKTTLDVFDLKNLIFAGVFVVLLGLLLVILWRIRKKCLLEKYSAQEKTSHTSRSNRTMMSTGNSATLMTTHLSAISTATTKATTLVAKNVIAKPGYLKYQFGEDFSISHKIAEGGSGDISLGRSLNESMYPRGSEIIIKAFKENENLAEALEDQFIQEVAVLALLRSHRNIAKIVGYCDEPAMIVMKYYIHGSVSSWLSDVRAVKTKAIVCQFVRDIGDGLLYMHSTGLAHNDMKSANVLIDQLPDGKLCCVITDLGLTQIISMNVDVVKGIRLHPITGMSLIYASPETISRIRNRKNPPGFTLSQLPRGDIYSFAIIMFDLICRRNAWIHQKVQTRQQQQ